MTKDSNSLKSKVLKGGIYMSIRQFAISLLSLLNILIVARILGPEKYGVVTVSLGIFYFSTTTARLGIHRYIVRKSDIVGDELHSIRTFYFILGIFATLILWSLSPAIGWWSRSAEVAQAIRWLAPGLCIDLVGIISLSMLERELRFIEVGVVETVAQVANYLTAIGLVLLGWEYQGPVIGTLVRFILQTFLVCRLYPIPISLSLNLKDIKPALSYGLSYFASEWILTLKNMRVSVIVSRLLGVEAAGFISIAVRLSQQLAMLRHVFRRMSISVMAKLVDEPDRMRNAISKSMVYQVATVGSICAAFSCLSAWIVPIVFGEEWLTSVKIFPFIAFGILVSSIFDLHASALYAVGRNFSVARLNLLYVGLLWLMSIALIPSFQLWGYGFAEIIALVSFFLAHQAIVKLCGSPNYIDAALLAIATSIPLFLGIWLSPLVSVSILFASYSMSLLIRPSLRSSFWELFKILRKKF